MILDILDWLAILVSCLIIGSGLAVLSQEKDRLELGVTKLKRIQNTLIQIRASEAQSMLKLGQLSTVPVTNWLVLRLTYTEKEKMADQLWQDPVHIVDRSWKM